MFLGALNPPGLSVLWVRFPLRSLAVADLVERTHHVAERAAPISDEILLAFAERTDEGFAFLLFHVGHEIV